MALYILDTSVIRATLCVRNRNKTSRRGEWTVGPTRKVSFSDTPETDLVDASKTARTFVVELETLRTTWIGR